MMMKSLLLAFTVLLVVTSSHVSLARVVDQTNSLHSTRRHGSSRTSASMGSVPRSVPAWSWLLQEVRGGGDAGVVPVGQPEDTTATMEDKWMGSSESTTPMDPDNPQVVDGIATTSTSSTVESSSSLQAVSSRNPPLLTRLADRVLPAFLMLLVVGGIAHWGKEDGLIYFTLGVQGALYSEMTRVIGGDFAHVLYKWYWFLVASLAWNVPKMMPWWSTQISTIVAGMTVLGIMMAIVQFQYKGAQGEEFRDFLRQAAVSCFSATLVVLPSSYWIATLEHYGRKWVALPALLVIINDTMAYVFGKTMGRHPILSVISPSKTWEGFIGAALSTMGASYFLLESRRDALVLGLGVSIIGPFGGFLASLIKRAYAEKDFGTLFQGHGGFVDRLDCQMILAPLVFLYMSLTQQRQ